MWHASNNKLRIRFDENMKGMKQIQLPKANTPTEYVVVRVQIVHVKKGWLGFKDKELSSAMAIPNKPKEAADLFNKIGVMIRKYGVTIG